MRKSIAVFAALGLVLAPTAALGDAKLSKPNFVLPADHKAKILFVSPNVHVGTLNADDKDAPNAEWVSASVSNLQAAIKSDLQDVAEWQFMSPEQMRSSKAIEDLSKEFIDLQNNIVFRVPQGTFPVADNDLRKIKAIRRGTYQYKISDELATRLKTEGSVDYVMILTMVDRYSTSGRKASQILGAALNPTYMQSPNLPQHYGNAMLVDLHDGSVVWFYGRGAFGGDPRTAEGARKRIAEIMTNFPKPAAAKR